jgi:Zn-dependent metalloprotease
MRRVGSPCLRFVFAIVFAASSIAGAAEKEDGKRKSLDPGGVERLKARTGGQARISVSEATGAASFVGFKAGFHGDLMAESQAGARQKARAFLSDYAGMLGVRDVDAELTLVGERTDKLGKHHLTYEQSFRGVPVFAGLVRAHFEGDGRLVAVNGNLVPGIRVSPVPSRSAADAAAMAIALVSSEHEGREVHARAGVLTVYRSGLFQGIEGESYLTWQIEVGNGSDIREFVFVDAHTGKVVDRLPGIMDDLYRRAYDGQNLNQIPPSYPASPYWKEGDPFPTASTEANNMILASEETYDFFFNAFGRDSIDGLGAIMDSIFNRGYSCPNASWNGTFISFCPGFTTDDVTGHEWGHAYTQYTHNLIYAWQSGALNEAYSDIWGETIDYINSRGTDDPDNLRTDDACTLFFGTPPPVLTITGGPAAGTYQSRASVNEPPRPFTVGPTDMAIVATAAPFQPTGACGAVSGVSGKIAIVDWTLTATGGNECGSGVRATNVYNAGAAGILFVAPAAGILNLGSIAAIASVQVTNSDGAIIKAGLPAQATMTLGVGTANSVRWLMGEDITNQQLPGALRDMWNPRCFGNPGKVSDIFEYVCSTADAGGVHSNSGIPNHAFALLVDGGTYNGQTISAIGLTKAAHIYFRAAAVYQHSASNFIDHADAIEQSAADLLGVNLASLTDGTPTGLSITASDIDQVEKAMLAVEMRMPPAFCNFQPLLAQNPPALCTTGSAVQIFRDNFDTGGAFTDRWTVSHEGTTPDFTERDWSVVGDLPDDRAGRAMFGPNPDIGTCAPGGDETAVLHADSKQITIPNGVTNPRLTFVHWIATEAGWDGGNVKISVNDGPWTVIPAAAFIYNGYNATLFTAAQGNTNPIAGQQAFTGTDGGAVDGTWGRSIVNLTGIATAKDKIRLRFDIGNDGCTGRFGWYVDDLLVYRCN